MDISSTYCDSSLLKEEAARLGFASCGVARAVSVPNTIAYRYKQWIEGGGNAGMSYLENYTDKRCDPRLLVDGAQSVIVVALNYYPRKKQDATHPRISYYAYGKDYHEVMKSKLNQLLAFVEKQTGESGRGFCDTAPILEKYWAQEAGIGFIGKNNLLIIPRKGSYHFLGIILTPAPYIPDTPQRNRCGNCDRCIRHCPTQALDKAYTLNAGRCISYLTIEHRGEIDSGISAQFENRLYGCDTCQNVCPWNRFSTPTHVEEFAPSEALLDMNKEVLRNMSHEQYSALFRFSAMKRSKYEGIMRNFAIWEKNNK